MTTFKNGDITTDDADIIVNTVNCVGILGKGIALKFVTRYPHIATPYKRDCAAHVIYPGCCVIYPLQVIQHRQQYWAAFATKDHWFNPSQYEWISHGLKELSRLSYAMNITSIALPALGCGNGKLNWEQVYAMIMLHLWWVDDLRLYPP